MRIHRRTGGLALLVARAADALAREVPSLEIDALPSSLDDLFADIHRGASEESRERATVLELLSVAREPLAAADVAELLGLTTDGAAPSRAEVREHLGALGEFLLEPRRGVFTPWHRGLADFVRANVLGALGVAALEATFARWTAPKSRAATLSAYALRHHVRHALSAGDRQGALELLRDVPFLMARVEAGLVFDLVGELEEVGSHWASALRRHAHFLARYPAGLLSVLDAPRARSSRPWLARISLGSGPVDDARLFSFAGHRDAINGFAISSDETVAVTASSDGTARVWNVASGREDRCIEIHPTGDGAQRRRLLSVGFWSSGERILLGSDGHGLAIVAPAGEIDRWGAGDAFWTVAAYEPTGETHDAPPAYVVTGARSGEMSIWDTLGARIASHVVGGVLTCSAISSDGRRIAIGSTWDRVVILDLEANVLARIDDLGGTPWSLAFVQGGVVAACADGALRFIRDDGVVDWQSHAEGDRLYACAVSADGKRVVFGGARGTLHFARCGESEPYAELRAHEGSINAIRFVKNDTIVVSASDDGTLRGHRAAAATEPRRVRARITASNFSLDESAVFAGFHDGTLRRWNAADGTALGAVRAHASRITAIAFSDDGHMIATASQDATARCFRVARFGAENARITVLEGHQASVTAIAFVPPGGLLVTGSSDHTVRTWSLFGGRETRRFEVDDGVSAVVADTRGERIAAVTKRGSLHVWLAGGQQIATLEAAAPAGETRSLSFVTANGDDLVAFETSDGKHVAVRLGDGGATRVTAPPLEGVGARSFRRSSRGDETLLVDVASGAVVAAYPVALEAAIVTRSGYRAAGWSSDELHLLELRGGVDH